MGAFALFNFTFFEDKMTTIKLGPSHYLDDLEELVKAGLYSIKKTWYGINDYLYYDPDGAFETILIGDRQKKALKIDADAEYTFEKSIKRYDSEKFANIIKVYGEEKLRDDFLNLEGEEKIVALADMIDGTDLLERRLSNWCSAVTFFYPNAPNGKKILASFVALPSGKVYYATAKDETVKVKYINRIQGEVKNISGVSKVKKLQEASICFYGQKAKNFTETAKHIIFNHSTNGNLSGNFRLYTLAGIPMMMNLIDHEIKTARNIDAVFDISGQKPHDVVPGAFLALKAEATIKNLITGENMKLEDLEQSLLRPSASDSKLKYIIASTPELAEELSTLLSTSVK